METAQSSSQFGASSEHALERLMAALQNADLYPHPVAGFQVVETHISFVLLTGSYAYKLKKPLDLGFLDFSTLERRRFFCQEELRLNRRLAPDLYLEVVAIGGTPEDPRLSTQPAIEYALKMRQFPQDRLLDRLLAAGELSADVMDTLAGEVAAFHAVADRADGTCPHGMPAQVHAPVRANFAHLAELPMGPDDRDLVACLRRWTDTQYPRLEPLLAQRVRDGFVRECHGDMHLANMFLEDRRVVIFDGIEFNPELRWIDVMSEVAFVVMDLADRGRPDLGWRFLDAYLAHTGDYGGLDLLPFYLIYRALVRAKIAAIRAAQPDVRPQAREALWAGMRQYLELAETYTRRRTPYLAITHGVAGAGKSTAALAVATAHGALRLRSDVERQRLFQDVRTPGGPIELDAGIYSAQASELTYRRLAALARRVIGAGYPAIVDAAFLQRARRDAFRDLAAELQVPFVILECRADADELRRRVARRQAEGRDASEATVAVLEHQMAEVEALAPDERAQAVTCDTERLGEIPAALARRL